MLGVGHEGKQLDLPVGREVHERGAVAREGFAVEIGEAFEK
jgi:hypothetical protein